MTTNKSYSLRFNRPTTFVPGVVRSIVDSPSLGAILQTQNASFTNDIPITNSSSFRYDPIGSGLKSTQQINVDWSEFRNHTFFQSAQVKVNAAFDKFIDQYPFDGTQYETELFFDRLTGWEKHVYDQLPKNKGYLFFSGSASGAPGNSGTFVTVKDIAGAAYQNISRIQDGRSILNPDLNSMTFEFQIFVPSGATNYNSMIFQKFDSTSNHGYACQLELTSSTTDGYVTFAALSGSSAVSSSFLLPKNQWNHVAAVWDRNPLKHQWFLYNNQTLMNSSSRTEIGLLNFNSSNFYIGSGSTIDSTKILSATFSGAIDEFRIWKSIRTDQQRKEFEKKSVYNTDDLLLYFKFNEPSGSNTPLVLDHSGKSIHGNLSTDAFSKLKIRNINTASLPMNTSSMSFENLKECPILFPDHLNVLSLKDFLLDDAENYDNGNPNLITKLIPQHFLLEGQLYDGLTNEFGDVGTHLISGSIPNSSRIGGTQTLVSLLYIWATFFDEIKLYLDSFSSLINVDYNQHNTIPDQFLEFLANKHGIKLPPLFVGTSLEQFINGKNISGFGTNDYSLQYIQNQIWRRILINLRDIQTSKGTIHSIKSFIRATGIDPDNNFRIREYGGPTSRTLQSSREKRSENAGMLNFISGGIIRSPFLSGTRIEPGFPTIAGNTNDGLFTSGSWTVEGIYKIARSSNQASQSLARLVLSSSANTETIIVNLLAVSGSGITLMAKPNEGTSAGVMSLSLGGFNPMDGQLWNFSFGRERGDSINSISSSYFLRAGRNSYGEIAEEHVASVYFNDNLGGISTNRLQTINSSSNPSGSLLVIGSGTFTNPTTGNFLNGVSQVARTINFTGKVSQLRFWSKALLIDEWREHVRNFKSLGVKDPKKNYNFELYASGSFERVRIDASTDQQTISSSATGTIEIYDFSQNNLHFSGTLFPWTGSVIVPQRFFYGQISPKFDEAVATNKIRVRSFKNLDNLLNNEGVYAEVAPVYEIRKSEEPNDSNKFAIDFSISDALNQDIITMFSTLDEFNNALGDPNLLFSPDYPSLDILRNLYFKRLTEKINMKSFFEFYKWFDTNLGTFIQQLLPRRTKFNNINFVVESHALERAKIQYYFEDIYLGDSSRHGARETLLLQLFTGTFRKY